MKNNIMIQSRSVDINISDEDKCTNLLLFLPDLWDSLVVAISSNSTTLSFDDVVSSFLFEEMRQKNMERQSTDALFVRVLPQETNRPNSSCGRSKSRGRSKTLGKFVNVCWRFGKQENYKKQHRSKTVERGNGFDDATST
jgi:hypothetical protein